MLSAPRLNRAGRPFVRIHVEWLFVVVAGLMAACAAPANDLKTNSAPATVSTQIGLLPTAYILQQPVANQVIPLTPTPSPLIPTPSPLSPTVAAAPTGPIGQAT